LEYSKFWSNGKLTTIAEWSTRKEKRKGKKKKENEGE
jgi:hypothetical protein